tara:strand:- start:1016 stop:1282 length:267 start_codon:yes stop_codon:yes gene_type:complete
VNENYKWKANMYSVTYIKPALTTHNQTDMTEHAILLRLDVLLDEIKTDSHPAWTVKKILELCDKYVSSRKKREKELNDLLKITKDIVK